MISTFLGGSHGGLHPKNWLTRTATPAHAPKLTIAGFGEVVHFAAPEVLEIFVTGLRLAGLPEK